MATPAHIVKQAQRQTRAGEQVQLNELEKKLLNEYQKGFPLSPTPFADIAAKIGTSEALVLQVLKRLQDIGVISRIGPVFKPKKVGTSTLAAMAVPEDRLDEIADLITAYPEVNHNYEREHQFNLWFVVTAPDQEHLDGVLADMELKSGYPVLDLPLEKQFHIDLGFPLWC